MRRTLLAALLLSSASTALAQTPTPAAPAQAQAQTPAERLRRLFHDSDEANLRRNPIGAMFRGDYRYADQLGDFGSDAYFDAERRAAEEELAALRTIDRSALNPTDRISYDVFEHQRNDDLRDLQPDLLALTRVRPINHFTGIHTFYPAFASGRSAAPFRNVEDYDNNVRRHRQFVACWIAPSSGSARARLGRGRNPADDPQRHRPARHPARQPAGAIALCRAARHLPRGGAGGGAGPPADRVARGRPRRHLSGLSPPARVPAERLSAARPGGCRPHHMQGGDRLYARLASRTRRCR